MTVRTTFALDVVTEGSIQRLADLWKTSKAEVVRRSVAEAERAASRQSRPAPLEALQWLQMNGTLTEGTAQKLSKDSKRGWVEGWEHKTTAAKGPVRSKSRKPHTS